MPDYSVMINIRNYHNRDLSGNSFLITGGAGFIGANIVEYLLKFNPRKVRVLDNFSTGNLANIKGFSDSPAFELMQGDIRDLNCCQRALEGIEYVSHQAATGSVPRSINDPVTSNEVNVGGFLNMLVAARDAHVKRMVYAASSSVYGDHPDLPKTEDVIGNPLSPYAVSKYVNELYAGVFSRVYGHHTVGLRYFNVFGPGQSPHGAYAAVIPLFIAAALKNKPCVIYGDGETSRDFTFVENAVQANIKAMLIDDLKRHEVVNIAFGTSTTLSQLWESIARLAATAIGPEYRPERKGDVKHSMASIARAEQLLGYKPAISVQDGLALTVEWFKNCNFQT